jgi:hypothetical protein
MHIMHILAPCTSQCKPLLWHVGSLADILISLLGEVLEGRLDKFTVFSKEANSRQGIVKLVDQLRRAPHLHRPLNVTAVLCAGVDCPTANVSSAV